LNKIEILNNELKKIKHNKHNKHNTCLDCNKKILESSIRCVICENKRKFKNNKSNRPSYEQLLKDKNELKTYVNISKKYNVSDTTIRKWFNNYKKYNNT